ncbi:RAB34, member RAS oncogene family [Columba livia]|uniref:RAB34, member RAS oncogene family n=1 Tax=Columba livia TaxID=8932 RepID=A0A2I0LKU7_COLLI|nr:RAB34, member RAS oncogene family [Columba livia]
MNMLAPVRRDRVIADLPPVSWGGTTVTQGACLEQRTGTVGFKISKIIVVGDLTVGKTCLINRFCKDTFDKNYKATIGVDFEMERFEENDPSNVILFLVGSKKDLSTPAQYSLMEKDALKVAQEMQAEYWAVSSLTGENVRDFFFRVAALTFESSVLAELERSSARKIGDTVRISSNESDLYLSAPRKKPKCCQ